MGHAYSLDNRLLHVPLVAAGPGPFITMHSLAPFRADPPMHVGWMVIPGTRPAAAGVAVGAVRSSDGAR